MMRPPPGGTSPHKAARSGPQNERISSAWRGRIGGIGPSGATAEGGAAAGASGASGAAAPGGGAPPSPMASTARRHRGESAAALTCKHRNAAAPPGLTPGQCTPKSERQAARTAPTCGEPGRAASFGIGADGGPGFADGSGGGAAAGSAPRAYWPLARAAEAQPPVQRPRSPVSARRHPAPTCKAPIHCRRYA
jgi:hypothetical protein